MQEDDGHDRMTSIMHLIFWPLFILTIVGMVWACFHYKDFF